MVEHKRASLGDLDESYPNIGIGQFELIRSVGDGAMGEVWLAHHAGQGLDVAIKVIVGHEARNARFHRAFRQEARSVASMNHPFVVEMIDFGVIEEETDVLSVGQFSEGSPFLVMEFARYGSLQNVLDKELSWDAVQLVLFCVLDALAHSHARGIVHRDIKPPNVLLTQSFQGWPGIRLTDYGLAYALRETQMLNGWTRTAGTPEYMAPEQITSTWRKYGPATDLYGLGCLAYRLIYGEVPFRGNNIIQIAQAHLKEAVPDAEPLVEVSAEIRRWLEIMLAKDPEHRFASAAASAQALRQCCEPLSESRVRAAWVELLSHCTGSVQGAATRVEHGSSDSLRPTHTLEVLGEDRVEDENRASMRTLLQIPDMWAPRQAAMRGMRLVGTGQGLFGLRRLPLVGREQEQRKLWKEFQTTAGEREVRTCLVTGAAGVGKDYLAEWFCDRAAELGTARILRVDHEDVPEIIDGIAQAVEKEFALYDLPRSEVEDFFKDFLTKRGATNRYEWQSITEIVSPRQPDDPGPRVLFGSSQQRYQALIGFLRRLTSDGPLVLWISDVQWGLMALSFVEFLLNQDAQDLPIFIVMTGRDDLLASSEFLREPVDAIRGQEATTAIEVEPLDDYRMRKLLEEALFMEPTTAYEVMRSAGGNPMHALAVIRQWIDGEMLEVTHQGYALKRGIRARLAPELVGVWKNIVDRLAGDVESTRIILEVGAILGQRFRRGDWYRATELMGLQLTERLIEELLTRKYVYETKAGLVFANNLFREALFESARSRERWQKLCGVCAEALGRDPVPGGYLDERSGFLLIEAGEVVEGVERLLECCGRRRQLGDYQAIAFIACDAIAALEKATGKRAKHLTMRFQIWRSHSYQLLNENEVAREAAEAAMALAIEEKEPLWEAAAQIRLATSLQFLGDNVRAKELCSSAIPRLQNMEGFESVLAGGYGTLINILRRQGQFERAYELLKEVRCRVDLSQEPITKQQLDYVELTVRFANHESVDQSMVDEQIARCKELGLMLGLATLYNMRAEIARREGDFSRAEADYQRSVEFYQLVEPGRGIVPRLNLAFLLLQRGILFEASLHGIRIRQELRRKSRPQMEMYCIALCLPALAADKKWSELEDSLQELKEGIETLQIAVDEDLKIGLRITGEILEGDEGQELLKKKVEELLAPNAAVI